MGCSQKLILRVSMTRQPFENDGWNFTRAEYFLGIQNLESVDDTRNAVFHECLTEIKEKAQSRIRNDLPYLILRPSWRPLRSSREKSSSFEVDQVAIQYVGWVDRLCDSIPIPIATPMPILNKDRTYISSTQPQRN